MKKVPITIVTWPMNEVMVEKDKIISLVLANYLVREIWYVVEKRLGLRNGFWTSGATGWMVGLK